MDSRFATTFGVYVWKMLGPTRCAEETQAEEMQAEMKMQHATHRFINPSVFNTVHGHQHQALEHFINLMELKQSQ